MDTIIPEDLTEFLHWVRATTEARWATGPAKDEIQMMGARHERFYGAKWLPGLTDVEIDALEVKWSLRFPPDMRLFLKILNAIDRPDYYEEEEWDANGNGTGVFTTIEVKQFHNWRDDDEEIARRLRWPLETILGDVIGANRVWLKVWGPRTALDAECAPIVEEWIKRAPRLIPIYGHRFLVGEPCVAGNPVLSVYGTDTIVYGWDLRKYLLEELEEDLCLNRLWIEPGARGYSMEQIPAYKAIVDEDLATRKGRRIPYWEDVIMAWSTGWGSFGIEYPRDGEGPRPVVRASDDDDEEPQQKQFTPF